MENMDRVYSLPRYNKIYNVLNIYFFIEDLYGPLVTSADNTDRSLDPAGPLVPVN